MPMYPARHWHRLTDRIIQCDLCPNLCKIIDGRRGRCFVRGNESGRMALYTDSRTSGMQVDPIEKKPLNHFLPASRVLSFGGIGCNLSCKFCQNWHITRSKDMDRLNFEVDPEGVAALAQKHLCDSIAFTYNDPIIFAEFAEEVAKAAHRRKIRTVAVTAGYVTSAARDDFFSFIDATNVDLKGFSQRFYSRLCNAKLGPVLETLQAVRGSGTWLEITNLVIPGWNDDRSELEAMCKWLREEVGDDVPLHFTAFHPDSNMRDVPHTPRHTLETARRIALDAGLRYVYIGNVDGRGEGGTTRCSCGAALITRDWYAADTSGIDTGTGRCRSCGSTCPGVFSPSLYTGSISVSRPYRVAAPVKCGG